MAGTPLNDQKNGPRPGCFFYARRSGRQRLTTFLKSDPNPPAIATGERMQTFQVRSGGAALALLGLALSLAACSSDQAPTNDGPGALPTGFGGVGGAVAATPSSGAGAGSGGAQGGAASALPNVCMNVGKGQVAQLDDFEDGNSVAMAETGREGYWYTVHDTTTGSIVPDSQFTAVPGGANGTQLAAHVQASGYSDWGALFDLELTYLSEGVHCPYNATNFAGLRFYLRGTGRIRVALVIPATQDKEYGGSCDPAAGMVCYDNYTISLLLSDQWTLYELPWSTFKQRGFGAPVSFDPGALMHIQFAFDTPDLPVDFWLDEVSFWDGQATPPVSNGEGGAGGASNTTDEGGAGASGDGTVAASEAGMGGAAGHSEP